MIRTIIIDDEPLAAEVIRDYLSAYKNIEVVQVCRNGFEGIESISRLQPQLVFLDIQMPKISALKCLKCWTNHTLR